MDTITIDMTVIIMTVDRGGNTMVTIEVKVATGRGGDTVVVRP